MSNAQPNILRPTGEIARTVARNNGETWTHQVIIPRGQGNLRSALAWFVQPAYSGRTFHRHPIIVRRTRRYVVVHQMGGLDI